MKGSFVPLGKWMKIKVFLRNPDIEQMDRYKAGIESRAVAQSYKALRLVGL